MRRASLSLSTTSSRSINSCKDSTAISKRSFETSSSALAGETSRFRLSDLGCRCGRSRRVDRPLWRFYTRLEARKRSLHIVKSPTIVRGSSGRHGADHLRSGSGDVFRIVWPNQSRKCYRSRRSPADPLPFQIPRLSGSARAHSFRPSGSQRAFRLGIARRGRGRRRITSAPRRPVSTDC